MMVIMLTLQHQWHNHIKTGEKQSYKKGNRFQYMVLGHQTSGHLSPVTYIPPDSNSNPNSYPNPKLNSRDQGKIFRGNCPDT